MGRGCFQAAYYGLKRAARRQPEIREREVMQKMRIVAEWGGYPYFQAAFVILCAPVL